jgi:hypothetical protein
MGLEPLYVSMFLGVASVSKLAGVTQYPVGWADQLDIGSPLRANIYHHQAKIPFPTTATI